ncbi:bifunctional dihydrofolate reductase-thymidylate synthase [Artemisia annua]|uniref:Bifunctional dihydrofolate reductase-thymidylate synthase n=1 Tax=Artemisia annua TaxID=35608 RepID=A0A2U1N268_ARTAN|nr:bifunctional dihydrofolate reductase-thymidylate synthase [Artemisia annua]
MGLKITGKRNSDQGYSNMHADYSSQGFDQLLDVINKIKNNPDDRRILLSAIQHGTLQISSG